MNKRLEQEAEKFMKDKTEGKDLQELRLEILKLFSPLGGTYDELVEAYTWVTEGKIPETK